jgi:hypothetical protein
MSRLGEGVPGAGRAEDQETKYALEDIRFARLEQSEEAKSSWVGLLAPAPCVLCSLFPCRQDRRKSSKLKLETG